MTIAATWVAFASISGISIVARYAGLAVLPSSHILTLLTNTLVDTLAVAIALASCSE